MGICNNSRFISAFCYFLTFFLTFLHYFSFGQRFSWFFILSPMYVLDIFTFISTIVAAKAYFKVSISNLDIIDVDCLVGSVIIYVPKTTLDIVIGLFLTDHPMNNFWIFIGPYVLLIITSTISCLFKAKYQRFNVFEAFSFTVFFVTILSIFSHCIESFPAIFVYLSIIPGALITSSILYKVNYKIDSLIHFLVCITATFLIYLFHSSFYDPTNNLEIRSLKALLLILMIYCVYHMFFAPNDKNCMELGNIWLKKENCSLQKHLYQENICI
eukprot:TRINITY_DN265_c0_g1_i1.p1 TRINITY_DN265_c0_g1~~TRINITY_DN265_c0_g1_i1.p1  ORF type:complete len:290 (+),score=37.63 TRINITY_DN265_c0_g1_i1:58-870(+)